MSSAVILANPSDDYVVGGAENQLLQLGKELASRGENVIFIGNVEYCARQDGFSYEQLIGNWASLRGLLRLYWCLKRNRADVLITRVLNPLLPAYGFISLLLGIKLFYFAAHDWEIESRSDKRINGWRWLMFWVGIQLSNKIFVQNQFQLTGFKNLLLFGSNRVKVSRNIPLMHAVNNPIRHGKYVSWIGSYRPHKRPEWVLEMAKKLPEESFLLILDIKRKYQEVIKQFEQADKTLDNFTFIPGVPRNELMKIYEKSKVVLITSEGEGFPNVAIEAWSQATPVISTFNNALNDFKDSEAVTIADSLNEMINLLAQQNQKEWELKAKKALNLFNSQFDKNIIVSKIIQYFP